MTPPPRRRKTESPAAAAGAPPPPAAAPVAWPAELAGAEGAFLVPLAVTDGQLRVQWLNAEAARVFGAPAEALIGRHWYELLPETTARRALHEQLLRGEIDEILLDDLPVRMPNGASRHFSVRVRAIPAREGQGPFVFGVAADVSGRVAAEQALRTSEERYRALATHSRDLILIVSGDARIQYSSPAMERALGYAVSERLGKSVFELVHPDDAVQVRGRFAELAAWQGAGEIAHAEFRVQRKNGEWMWIQMVGVNLLEHPAVRGVLLTGRDITPRKRAEAALAAERARLDMVLSGAQVGTWKLDYGSGLIELDENAYDLAGVTTRLAVTVETWLSAVHRDERAAVEDWFARTLAADGAWHETEYRHVAPGGRSRWVLVRGHAVATGGGGARQLVGIVIDVSGRRATEAALRASESRYRSLAHLVNGYVFEGRVHPDYRVTISWASPRFEEVFGCTVAELNRRGWHSFLHPLDAAASTERAQRLLRGETSVAETRIVRGDGALRWLRVAAEPIRDGEPGAVLGMGEDITDRKVLEEQLLAAANREQQRIGNDLHDGLGQVLTGIGLLLGGHANAVRRGRPVAAADLDAVTRLVNSAIKNARSLARGLSPVALDAGGIAAALEDLALTARTLYGIDVRFVSRLDAPLAIDATRSDHLYRIAQEALSNAGRHAQARQITIELAADAARVRLTVRDDGIGIPAGHDRSGMGMKIMEYRARTIGGTLAVQAAPGGGTQVECLLRHDVPDLPPPGRPATASRVSGP